VIPSRGLPPGLAEALQGIDPSRSDEDLLGPIAERHLVPEDRLALGQFFTPTPLVDLVLSFCLQDARARVLDPACGTGAFLVRAFVRKRHLEPGRAPARIAAELFGVDADPLPAELARLNLAALGADAASAPGIHRRDFLTMEAPSPEADHGLGRVDAVVANPPWVQQESIASHGAGGPADPATLRRQMADRTGCRLSGRSDLHAYFWPQASLFLRSGGRLGFVTSAQWLDAGYGDELRRWLPGQFTVEVILESTAEPWFPGARVDSQLTVLRRATRGAGPSPPARLVQLRRPLPSLMSSDGTTEGALAAADDLRDRILGPETDDLSADLRVRVVSQKSLVGGPRPGRGGRGAVPWGRLLREPEIWSRVLGDSRDRWVPVEDRCDVRRGITSGCDGFFYPRDVTVGALDRHPDPGAFLAATGADRQACERGDLRLMRCGLDASEHPVEARCLVPLVHGPLEMDSLHAPRARPRRLALWLPEGAARGPHVDRYLRHGRRLGVHRRATCTARASRHRAWFDLTRERVPGLLWPKERQFRHLVPANPAAWAVNCRLYEIRPREPADVPLWAGVLNSTWTLLSSLVHGRPVGAEAVWSTMVGEVKGMPVPDPLGAAGRRTRRIARAFGRLQHREPGSLLPGPDSELGQVDRRVLDDAVLVLLGFDDRSTRSELIDALYAHLERRFRRQRDKELRANAHKRRRRGQRP